MRWPDSQPVSRQPMAQNGTRCRPLYEARDARICILARQKPETGCLDADRSGRLDEAVCRRVGPYVCTALALWLSMIAALGLASRPPRHRAHDGGALACRPNSTARSINAPCSLTAGPSARPATDGRSRARRRWRSRPRGRSHRAVARRAWPAESSARPAPIRRRSGRLDTAAHGDRPHYGVQRLPRRAPLSIDSGARQRITTDSSDSTTFWIGS